MINPIIFSLNLYGFPLTLRWYGVLVMLGAVIATWLAEKEINRRGEKGERIWDALTWVLPIGIIGARVWYVVNNIFGGSTYYYLTPPKKEAGDACTGTRAAATVGSGFTLQPTQDIPLEHTRPEDRQARFAQI